MATPFAENTIDARRTDLPDDWEADVCIIGGGAAGITVARRLIASNRRVLLVESGSRIFEPDTQALYEGRSLGIRYDLAAGRLRFLGGTTNHWNAYCYPIRERDFTPVPGLELTVWPIDYAEMEPYFRESEAEFGLDLSDFQLTARLPAAIVSQLQAAKDIAAPRVLVQIDESKRRFAQAYAPALANRDLRVLLNANVTEINLDDYGRRVRSVQVKTTNGRAFTVRARTYVLACHAIENARLLLASNRVQKTGIGNAGGWVGRCFMEHPVLFNGILKTFSRESLLGSMDVSTTGRSGFWTCLELPEGAEQAETCMQLMTFFRAANSWGRFSKSSRRLRAGSLLPYNPSLVNDVVRTVDALQDTVDEFAYGFRTYEVHHVVEQAPNPSSRVVLSEERDQLGSRRANLDWRLSEPDYRTLAAAEKAIPRFAGALELGRMFSREITPQSVDDRVGKWDHHIGTTRMSASGQTGVVDRDCRVHGVENLYVAGSSVFCRSIYSPTMAIVAFSLRLADHLRV
jgi:choline dehydrogenase-like flavoprotein